MVMQKKVTVKRPHSKIVRYEEFEAVRKQSEILRYNGTRVDRPRLARAMGLSRHVSRTNQIS